MHLRLARARGSLTAPNSVVQDRALTYLLMLEETEKVQSRIDMVKGLLVSPTSNFDRVREQFPEFFDPFEEAKQEDGTYDIDKIDATDVEWGTPTSAEEDDDLSRWIASRESGSFTGADFE